MAACRGAGTPSHLFRERKNSCALPILVCKRAEMTRCDQNTTLAFTSLKHPRLSRDYETYRMLMLVDPQHGSPCEGRILHAAEFAEFKTTCVGNECWVQKARPAPFYTTGSPSHCGARCGDRRSLNYGFAAWKFSASPAPRAQNLTRRDWPRVCCSVSARHRRDHRLLNQPAQRDHCDFSAADIS